ncbi:hypothetical protein A2U01_0060529, partial [Trifolium medium]|nr:hypothetical protein [Trifolium medium]
HSALREAQPTWSAAQPAEAKTALNKARARRAAPPGAPRSRQQLPNFSPKHFELQNGLI